MNLGELRSELAQGRIRPAYLVAGEEPLLRDDAQALLREAALSDGPADFNCDRLEGESARPRELLDAVATLPVMAQRRLVVLREPEAARGQTRHLTDAIAEVVPSLAARRDVVLVVVAQKVDRRARWIKAFREPAAEVRCDPPRAGRDLVAFVVAEAKRQGARIAPGAAELLAERVGPQLLVLRREIEKAVLLAGPREEITRFHVAAGTRDVSEESIWDLTDAIGEGRGDDALVILAKSLRSGAAAPQVLGALASHFRKLLRLRTGGTAAGPPFALKKLRHQAGRYSPRRLHACLRAIHDTDLALKGAGALGPELALERLVIGLAS